MLWLDFCIHLLNVKRTETAKEFILFEVISIVVFVAILWISYIISKPRRPKPETALETSEPSESSELSEPSETESFETTAAES
jgi:hypothetical protein